MREGAASKSWTHFLSRLGPDNKYTKFWLSITPARVGFYMQFHSYGSWLTDVTDRISKNIFAEVNPNKVWKNKSGEQVCQSKL